MANRLRGNRNLLLVYRKSGIEAGPGARRVGIIRIYEKQGAAREGWGDECSGALYVIRHEPQPKAASSCAPKKSSKHKHFCLIFYVSYLSGAIFSPCSNFGLISKLCCLCWFGTFWLVCTRRNSNHLEHNSIYGDLWWYVGKNETIVQVSFYFFFCELYWE